jgi:fructokinase
MPVKVTVIGEAVVDLVPDKAGSRYSARPGGSPYNVAIGLARLGVSTSLMARLSDSAFGQLLRRRASSQGVDLGAAPCASEPASVAVVSLDEQGRPSYDFYGEASADWQWSAAEVAQLPADTAIVHFGSIASWTPPGSEQIVEMVARVHGRGEMLVSYDPNIRPSLLGDRAEALRAVERCAAIAHLVKASTQDIAWLYPDDSAQVVSELWLALGAKLVVVTDGPHGARVLRESGSSLGRGGIQVDLVDTIGAGDAFTSGFLASLAAAGITSPSLIGSCDDEVIVRALDYGVRASALVCERLGADPPSATEMQDARRG